MFIPQQSIQGQFSGKLLKIENRSDLADTGTVRTSTMPVSECRNDSRF